MKKILGALFLIGATLFLLSDYANAQAVYGPEGQYRGYMATTPNGVSTMYTPEGRAVQSYQTDGGQTSFYSPAGRYQGVATAPIYTAPNVTYTVPREVPQVRSIGGW